MKNKKPGRFSLTLLLNTIAFAKDGDISVRRTT
jgi:hypothetical protein